jgi:formate dehydrogenase subunit gamma
MRSLSIVRAAVVAAAALCLWTPAGAQQHTPVAPTGDLVKEQQERQIVQPYNNAPVWKEVRAGTPQYSSLPGRANSVLIQSEGQTWRAARVPISTTGGFVFAAALVGALLFYMWRGPILVHGRPTGHLIRRFTIAERAIHWTVAITFTTLAVTGLIITFGRAVLLPLIGYTLFSWLAILAKNLHNFVGPILAVALPIMIVKFVGENIPRAYDWVWIRHFGGMFDKSGAHPPAGKANAGQKGLFWIMVVAAGLTLVVTGLILDFPNFGQTRQTMQLTNVIHMVAGLIAVTFLCAHIYLGTIGMKGAYEAMRYGYVDEAWAREHHEIWYNEVMHDKAARGLEGPDAAAGPRVA